MCWRAIISNQYHKNQRLRDYIQVYKLLLCHEDKILLGNIY